MYIDECIHMSFLLEYTQSSVLVLFKINQEFRGLG